MAPKRYIQARQESLSCDDTLIAHDIDNKPYRPNLRVETAHGAKRAAALFVLPSDVTIDDNIVEKISSEKISGGITNVLYKVSGLQAFGGSVDAVLVRLFGAEGMIDRDIENSTYAALSHLNIAPPYYGRFANGRIEGWMEGMRPLAVRDMALEDISAGIAEHLARLHQVVIPEHLSDYYKVEEPSMWTQLEDWYQQAVATKSFQTPQDTERAVKLELDSICDELDWLKSSVVPRNAAVAFCHNDALCANILYDDNERRIQLIDFEYGGMNYVAFDIANHFNEYAGGTDNGGFPNYEWLPAETAQRRFLRKYLTRDGQEPSDVKIDKLMEEVQSFLMANHLYWSMWAVNQAATEGCDDVFDFLEYAKNRIAQYRVCKNEWNHKYA